MLVVPVPYVTPDGAERNLRFSQGAKRRLAERFGAKKDIGQILHTEGDNAIIECAYFMMYDRKGNPPEGLTLDELFEDTRPDELTKLLAAVMSAVTQGETPKNDLEALFGQMLEIQQSNLQNEIQKIIGSGSGASVDSASDSASVNSGGVRRRRSRRALTVITNNEIS